MLSLITGFFAPLVLTAAPVLVPHHATVPVRPALHMNQSNWRHMPYSGGVLFANAVRNGWIHTRPSSNHIVQNLKCKKPLPCAFTPVDASTGSQPVNETPVAVNPNNKRQIITGGNDYNCNAIQGYYESTDGGKTWNRTCGVLINGGGDGDPVVGFDLNNVSYRGGIDAFSNGQSGIIISHSTDGGKTWSTPVTAAPNIYTNGLADKPWLQIDTNKNSPRKNTLYVSVTQFDASNNTDISVSHSTDGGMTWQTVAIGQFQSYPVINQFSDLAIAPDGTVYVTWMRCTANGTTGDCGGTTSTMLVAHSTDGGVTWSSASTIASAKLAPDSCGAFYGCVPNTNERLSNVPSSAVDNSNASPGTLYASMYNYTGSFCQVLVTKSTNGGVNWSAPVAVAPPSDTHDQFFPWLNVSTKDGTVGATWMDRRNDPSNVSYEEYAGLSSDGGTTFANVQLTSSPSNPNNDGFGGSFMGDYTGNSWDSKKSLYASWTDTSTGHAQDFIGGTKN